MQICLTLAVSSSAVMFGSYGMGSPTNVRSLTGNPPYIGTTGNLIHSYSFLSISNIKEKKKGKGGEKRETEITPQCFFFPSPCFKTETGLSSNPASDPDSQMCHLKKMCHSTFHFPKFALTPT